MANILDQSYTGTVDGVNTILFNSTLVSFAQPFIPDGLDINRVTLKLSRTGSPSGSVWAEIWTDTGSHLPSSQTGADSSTQSAGSISTSATDYDFDWVTPITLTPGSKYWITVWANYATSEINNIQIHYISAGEYAGGGRTAIYNGTSWSLAGGDADYYFLEYSSQPLPSGLVLSPSRSLLGVGV